MKNILKLNATEREKKTSSRVLSRVKENDNEKKTEVALEILKKSRSINWKKIVCLQVGK